VITIVSAHPLLALIEPQIQLPKRLPERDEFRQVIYGDLRGGLGYLRLSLTHFLADLMQEVTQIPPTEFDLMDAAGRQPSGSVWSSCCFANGIKFI